MKHKIQRFWQQHSPRERLLLGTLTLLLLGSMLWLGLWQPLQNGIATQQQRIDRHRDELSLLQQIAATPQRPQVRVEGKELSVESIISQSAKTSRLTPQRIDPQGDTVRVELATVPFDSLLSWLVMLEQRYQIRVDTLELQAITPPKGLVQVKQLTLRRGGNE